MVKELIEIAVLYTIIYFITGCSAHEKITLVENGKCNYSIYLSSAEPESVKNAAEELKNYFKKVTGVFPSIIMGGYAPDSPYIGLGITAANAAGLDTCDIPLDGFRIVSQNNDLFIFGPDTPSGQVDSIGGVKNGTRNGVFTFIEDYLGVHWLMPGEFGEAYKPLKTVQVPVVNRMEASPFDYRVVATLGNQPIVKEWEQHLKLGEVAAVKHNHAWRQTIPATLFDEHPDWFAHQNGKPISPTDNRYKLETTNPELVQAYADTILKTFRNNPSQRFYSLSPTDGGGSNWSDSPTSTALLEDDPYGKLSRTPLILKFYNDVAKIVGLEFPDHNLCGYLYNDYRWPPSNGLNLEPNLVLMLVGHTHHYRLFRTHDRLYRNHSNYEINEVLMRTWGKLSTTHNFDLYFYDYPIWMRYRGQKMMAGLIWPPTPENLNFIFSRLGKYNFKGAYIYGNRGAWPAFGIGNYILAKLFWNPGRDEKQLYKEYLNLAYGLDAAPYIDSIYTILDTSFRKFYNKHVDAGSSLTEDHLKEIYTPNYMRFEKLYLMALEAEKTEREQDRLVLLGQILAQMQNTLKVHGLISSDYTSRLTLSPEEIKELLSTDKNSFMTKFKYFD